MPKLYERKRVQKKDRNNSKKIQKYETINTCQDALPLNKRRLTEVQSVDTSAYNADSRRVVDMNAKTVSPNNCSNTTESRSSP